MYSSRTSTGSAQRYSESPMRGVAHRLLSKYDEIYPNAMDNIEFNDTDDLFYLTRGYGKDAEVVGFLMGQMRNLRIF